MGNLLVKDKKFYKSFFSLAAIVCAQSIIALGVNLADNVMLGAYSETALSGVAAVNQIQFVLQQLVYGISNGMIVLCNIRLKQHGKEYAQEFVDAMKGMEEVTECYNTSGDFDFIIKVYVRDMHHYQDFVLNRLGEMKSIGSVHSVFVIGTVKDTHSVPVAQ